MAYRDQDAPSYFAEAARSGTDDDQARDDAYRAHMGIIDAIVTDWQAGMMTVEQKRRAVSAENKAFYGPGCSRHLIWP